MHEGKRLPEEMRPDELPVSSSPSEEQPEPEKEAPARYPIWLKATILFVLGFFKSLVAISIIQIKADPIQYLLAGIIIGGFDAFTYLAAATGARKS